MALAEQAQLFSQCRYLIGIHGAGLINMIYAHHRALDLLEIRQPGEEYRLTDFAQMCQSYGFKYYEIFGTPSNSIHQILMLSQAIPTRGMIHSTSMLMICATAIDSMLSPVRDGC